MSANIKIALWVAFVKRVYVFFRNWGRRQFIQEEAEGRGTGFSISVFGRFAYTLSALALRLLLDELLGDGSFLSFRMCVSAVCCLMCHACFGI